ncbi:hypothetical protein [Nocardia sp. NPDC004860]|uniref:hypothetical protein n=1 Tax=Nocardia sp. NPDC004860 TaxID=3154557 RepID=UPI0033A03DD7
MEFEITALAARSERGLFGTMLNGYEATVVDSEGNTYGVSQLEHESPQWGVDSAFSKNGYPYFSNGFGCRVVKVRAIADEIAQALNTRRDKLAAEIAAAEAKAKAEAEASPAAQ